jgi:spermidine synthase
MAADLIKEDHVLFNNSQLSSQLAELGVDSQSLFSSIKFTGEYQDWDSNSIILTDQFSPANLLNLEND